MKHAVFASIVLSIVMLSISCSLLNEKFPATETVEIRLPSAHPLLERVQPGSSPSYSVHWYDAQGNHQARAGVRESFSIELETGCITPILVYCESEGCIEPFLPPAGAIYPVHGAIEKSSLILETTWLRGISAGLVEDMCLSSDGGFETGRIIAGHFNWLRFDSKIAERKLPPSFDRERFLSAILSGKVTVYDISPLKESPVELSIPKNTISEGCAFESTWPEQTGFIWSDMQQIVINVPEGLTCFFSPEGYISIQVEKGKKACTFFSRYSLQD